MFLKSWWFLYEIKYRQSSGLNFMQLLPALTFVPSTAGEGCSFVEGGAIKRHAMSVETSRVSSSLTSSQHTHRLHQFLRQTMSFETSFVSFNQSALFTTLTGSSPDCCRDADAFRLLLLSQHFRQVVPKRELQVEVVHIVLKYVVSIEKEASINISSQLEIVG